MILGEPPLIVFDGICALCSAGAEFVLRRDRRRLFRFTTAQSEAGRACYHRFGLDPDAMTTMIVVVDGQALVESDAILAILARLGWPWRAASAARIVPRAIRDPVYRWIARNRYRWVKPRTVCWRPDADMADRVI